MRIGKWASRGFLFTHTRFSFLPSVAVVGDKKEKKNKKKRMSANSSRLRKNVDTLVSEQVRIKMFAWI